MPLPWFERQSAGPRAKKVLFVCYGGSHVCTVIPVAKAMCEQALANVHVLGLTTAAQAVRSAGLSLMQFKDFIQDGDQEALRHGRELLGAAAVGQDVSESQAYLGLSYADLVAEHGPSGARQRYEQLGRHAFLPVRTMRRILERVRPDLVVVTTAPRAERAATIAAAALGIPAVCLFDRLAMDEAPWIGEPGYAHKVCVLSDSIRSLLVAGGRRPKDVVVTGNPAFDALTAPASVAAGRELRELRGWQGKRVVLWPTQVEPQAHPLDPTVRGDPLLPSRVLRRLERYARSAPDVVLCVRSRRGENAPHLSGDDRIVVAGQDWPVPALLHAVDAVVTLSSTLALEAHACAARVVQVRGSVFEQAMPLERLGIAHACVPLQELAAALDRCTRVPRPDPQQRISATQRVLSVVAGML